MRARASLVSLAVAGALTGPALSLARQAPPRAADAAPGATAPSAKEAVAPRALVIGLVPEVNVFQQRARYAPLGAYLGQRLGVPVRFSVLSRYGEVLPQLEAGRLDGVFVGSLAGAIAIARLGAVPIARPVNLDGTSTYNGYLFVRKDSGIADPSGMRGKRMAFVDRGTTAGYLFPVAWLRERGVGPPQGFFKEVWFAGSHDAAVAAVLDRRAEVGAAKSTVYDRVRTREPRVDRELLILASSPPVPSNGLCVRKDLEPHLRDGLRAALLALEGAPEGAKALGPLDALRFVETTAADYAGVLELARKAGVDLRRWNPRRE